MCIRDRVSTQSTWETDPGTEFSENTKTVSTNSVYISKTFAHKPLIPPKEEAKENLLNKLNVELFSMTTDAEPWLEQIIMDCIKTNSSISHLEIQNAKLAQCITEQPSLEKVVEPIQTLIVRKIDFCLLYTSPSPRDLSTSRMPSSA
eukprot:TRINITY_DN36190_c0_g1_i3.p1 TRINITY_DN36190_c0_g1~~TRINITY_DN36190_c0_g1_i3.p1  ORF type:complete len:147 (+),score=32.41 TRINITY_DN36190_c0_g1_i3:151-591(+)